MNTDRPKCFNCNKNAIDFDNINNLWFCKKHKLENTILIYKYPQNTKLNDIPSELKLNNKEKEHFNSLNNYINFKISGLLNDEEIPLVMMKEPINPLSIANFLSKNIEWMATRNDIYKLTAKFEDYYINQIQFDNTKNIYIIYITI
jgi:hypothetical protein